MPLFAFNGACDLEKVRHGTDEERRGRKNHLKTYFAGTLQE